MAAEIRIHGIREMGAALRAVDREAGKELQRGLKGVAEKIAGKVRARAGSPGAAIRARATQKSVGLAFPAGEGRGKHDFYPWWDFGGTTGPGHVIGQAWSGSVRRPLVEGGRYLYPTIAENRGEIASDTGDVIVGLARKHGFVTRG